MMWICQLCPNSRCKYCANNFDDLGDAIEHIRKAHGINKIGRPGAVGCPDSHDHVWYCSDCETAARDHKSFDSDEAMLQHLTARHKEYIKANTKTKYLSSCPSCG
jgi:hypothetical protein